MEATHLRIKLRKNQSTLPSEKLTSQVSKLEILGDSIETIPSLEHLTKCEYLSLNCPQLLDLNELPGKLKILKIKGGHTCPQNLPHTLEILQISAIQSSLSKLKIPQGVVNLDLSSNGLTALANLNLGAPLSRLNLDNNQLTCLPDSLYRNKSLLHLSLDGNPLTDEQKNKLHQIFGIWF